MRCFAFGAKWGASSCPKPSRESSEPSAAVPMPAVDIRKNRRRVMCSIGTFIGSVIVSSLADEFVQVQDDVRHEGPGGELRRGDRGLRRQVADGDRFLRAFGIMGIRLELP